MDAARLAGIPGWLELPPAVDHVARAIPRIVWRHLSTVVGTMIREREIMWLAGAVRLPEDLVRPLREPVIDPAIAIGPIVLTGWETPEHRQPGWWMRLDRYLAGRPRPQSGRLATPPRP